MGALSLILRIQKVYMLFIASILTEAVQLYLLETEHLKAYKNKQILIAALNTTGWHCHVLLTA